MDWNTLLFLIFPYVAIILAIIVMVYRAVYRPFTISSLSSQLLESKKLYWGSIPFHWGILIILIMHLLAILLPRGLTLWNAHPIRLYLLEITGLALGLWSLSGLLVLIWRRLSNKHIQAVTTPMDIIILLLLLVSVVTGVVTATAYRFGSYWFTGVFTPYIISLFTLQPNVTLVAPLPWVIKLSCVQFLCFVSGLPFQPPGSHRHLPIELPDATLANRGLVSQQICWLTRR